MNTENVIQLRDASIYPDNSVLLTILGESFEAFEDLLSRFKEIDLKSEWRYYKDGKAWLCKVQKKKKTIVWISVWSGFFKAAIYIPLRLLDALLELDIDADLKTKISETKNVGKSKPCIFEIYNMSLLPDFDKVMQFKIKSK